LDMVMDASLHMFLALSALEDKIPMGYVLGCSA
jgi:hypothetical protein